MLNGGYYSEYMTDETEDSLVRRFKNGDETAFNEIVRRYQKRLYFTAVRMLGNHDDAADISQDVFVKAYTSLRNFRGDSKLYTWLYRILVNLIVNHQRHKKLKELFLFEKQKELLEETVINHDSDAENSELAEAIRKAVEELPTKQRTIFILKQYEELTYQEIAKILNRSVGGVKANYFHAVKKLQQKLSKFR